VSVVANVAINVDSRNAVSKLQQVESQAKITERAFQGLSSALAAFGAGFAISRVIQDVRELDTNIRRLATVGVDVAKINPALSSLSKELGGVASKAELAAASYQAASAGFSDTAGNIEILRAATKAAVGGLADAQAVTEVLVKTLNAYGLAGTEATKVTDSISKAIELGNQEWTDYTSQLGRVVSVAALAGVNLNEVNAFIAAATKNGATAEIAFTGLGAAFNTLLQPTKESTEAAAALGIQWNIGGLQAKGFTGLLEELSKKQDANKETVARLLGSQEAMRGVFAANAKGGKDYQMILEQLGSAAGKTDSDFKTMKDSLDNQLKALDTAFKNVSEAVGGAFGPTVVQTISDVADAMNAFADVVNAIPQPVATGVAEIIKLIAQMILLQKAIQAIIALRAGFVAAMSGMAATTAATGAAAATSSSAFALYTANTKTLQAAAAGATPALAGLRGILASLASIGTIAIAINIAVYGIQAVLQARAELDRLRGIRQSGGAAATFGGSAPAASKKAAQDTLKAIEVERKKNLPMQAIGQISGFGRGLGNTREQILAERERFARGVIALPTRTAQAGGLPGVSLTPQAQMPGGADKDAQKAKDKAAQEAARMQQRLQGITIETNAIQKQSVIKDKIVQAEIAGDKQLQARLQGEERNQQIITNLQGALVGVTDERERQALIAKTAAELDASAAQTANELLKLESERKKAVEDVVNGIDMELLKLRAITDVQKQALQFIEIENGLKAQGIKLTEGDAEAIRKKIAEIQKLTKEQKAANAQLQMEKELLDGITNTVASTFSSALDAAVQGTENFGDALKDLGADLLATIGNMLIMYAIAQALGVLGGGDSVGIISSLATAFGYKPAKEGAYWPGGFEAFADGGVVTSPTMGLIGEGGEPEYVIPASKMRGAMSRYASGARGSSVIPSSGETGTAPGGGTAVATAIDVRYSVERINSVDYVTADQFQAGMQQAAAQGAIQGEQLAMRKLQQSASTRNRLGLK
jgi:TP901 family phage tail tape measure protein